MSPNRRILLNIVATYGRSLYALVIGLFCGRWALLALGETDYGLVGVIGGLASFIAFVNGQLAGATSRFYAVSVGEAKKNCDTNLGLENCRKWFSLAVTIHTFVSVVLILIGYPIGVWAIKNFLVIPSAKITDCIWVFRFVCLSCFIGMITVPYNAMYQAKQYIAELTIYSFVTTTLNFFFLYYIVTHNGSWLVAVGCWGCILGVVPNLIIAIRAIYLFRECRFNIKYSWDFERFKQLNAYVGWNVIGGLAWLFKGQGINILVNKFFGPSINASFQIANTVNGHATSLTNAMQGAFTPAITTLYGAGENEKFRRMAFQACKFGLISTLVFMLPLFLELPLVLRLWLKNPPQYVTGLCALTMVVLIVHQSAFGHIIAISASGKVALYQIISGSLLLLTLPIAWGCLYCGCAVYSVMVVAILTMALCVGGRLILARKIVGMSIRYWVFKIISPVLALAIVCCTTGWITKFFLTENIIQVIMVTLVCEVTFIPCVWFLCLDTDERYYILNRFQLLFQHSK